MGLTDKNLYAYCDNNPVVRVDRGGQFWETVFDIISLGASIVEVCINPTDPWAWAGLAGDAIDLIPFVTGVGEVTRAVRVADNIADTAKVSKKVNNAVDVTTNTKKVVNKTTRNSAVKKAWKNEVTLIESTGRGTRNWTDSEIEELLIKGKVKGYVGHHMKSVKGYPDLAGDPFNIQFLTRREHLRAHRGNWRNITHGRYLP